MLNHNVFEEWRASKDNIIFIENFYKSHKEQRLLDSTLEEYLTKLLEGLKEALKNNEIFYISKNNEEESISEKTTHHNSHTIIVLIDKECASATLTFLDLLLMIEPKTILIGEETASDSVYMDIARVDLPSKKGKLIYPMKVFRGRKRVNNETYKPDIII